MRFSCFPASFEWLEIPWNRKQRGNEANADVFGKEDQRLVLTVAPLLISISGKRPCQTSADHQEKPTENIRRAPNISNPRPPKIEACQNSKILKQKKT